MNSTVASHVRLDSLDGLRGIAVLLVVFGHGYHHRFEGSTEASFFINAVMDNSSFGVRLFFILSGFLITWLILREKTKTGSFHLTAFFRRRAFRILPAYLIYLLVMSSWATMGLAEIDLAQLLYTASFMWNYAYLFDQSGSLEGGWLLG
ncbi:MAG: acyltransferase, partial [Verrucomicrobiota bacterium]